jgi:hypothetical protein
MTKKIILIAMVVIVAMSSCSTQKAWNLRTNSAVTTVGMSAEYKNNNNTHSVGGSIDVAQTYKWAHVGGAASYTSDACFSGKLLAGGNVWLDDNFCMKMSATTGIVQNPVEDWYLNTNNGDKLWVKNLAPYFTVGAEFGLQFMLTQKLGLSASVAYDRCISSKGEDDLGVNWSHTEHNEDKNIFTAKLGMNFVIENDSSYNGDHNMNATIGGAYSSQGAEAMFRLTNLNRFSWLGYRVLGAEVNYYPQTGEFDFVALAGLAIYAGSNSQWTVEAGVILSMANCLSTQSGQTMADPNRVNFLQYGYVFGGKGTLYAEAGLQMARWRLVVYGKGGGYIMLSHEGGGDYNYQATADISKLYWAIGGSVTLTL